MTAVAPIGLRDRVAGTVSFTTSLGFGRKLERIERDPRVALAYHAREHGKSRTARASCSCRGSATVVTEPDPEYVALIGEQAKPFMGPPREGSSGTGGWPPTTRIACPCTWRSSGSSAGRTCAVRAAPR